MDFENLKNTDPETYGIIISEIRRQNYGVELIASENIVSKAVLEAMGNPMTNKYSEGMPKKRYYAGNDCIDDSETLAIERAKRLFGAEHVNVQPHAGSQANMESYFALLELKDKILGMSLDHGGHLTHGSPVNFSGKFYNFLSYGVDEETHQLNYDEILEKAQKEQPKLILSGASAYPRKIDFKKFGKIAEEVGAYSMADIAHIAGLIAAKLHPDAIPYCDVVTTTTHKTLRGPRGAIIMCKEKHAKAIDKAVFPGMQGGPLDHIIAAKAVAFGEALKPEFKKYQEQVLKNAKVMAEALMDNGIKLVSGGTDNHLMLVDLTSINVQGKQAETALENAGIYCNKNMIPFDKASPFNPSGIRLGTPAMTSRGFKEEEAKQIGEFIAQILNDVENKMLQDKIKDKIKKLCEEFKIYEEFL